MMKRRRKLLLPLCLMVLLLTGFGLSPVVELLDDAPMIDLGAAIKEAQYGQSGHESHEEGDSQVIPPEEEGKNKIITIKVRGEEVRLEKDQLFSLSPLYDRVYKKYKPGDIIYLVDDFADSSRYKEVLAILEKLEAEKGCQYSEQ